MTEMIMVIRRRVERGGTTAEWDAANSVLADREIGIDSTARVLKIGNGVTAWESLPVSLFLDGGGGGGGGGTNGILSGVGAPVLSLGINGDFYIDDSAKAIYGPKTSGGWGAATLLVGPQGPQGPEGPQGPSGVGSGIREVPTGDIDGVNIVFGVSSPISPGSSQVYLNGLLLYDEDYIESDSSIMLSDPPQPGDRLTLRFVPS